MAQRTLRIDTVQYARGFAATIVVLFHASMLYGPAGWIRGADIAPYFSFGYSGVILFFVVSGFIILHAHWNDAPTHANFIRYVKRRLSRIYPLSILLAAVVAGLAPLLQAVFSDADFLKFDAAVFWSSVTLIPFDCTYRPGAFWSLTNELTFYAVFMISFFSKRLFVAVFVAWTAMIIVAPSLPQTFLTKCPSSPLGLYNSIFIFGATAFAVARSRWSDVLGRWAGTVLLVGMTGFALIAATDVLLNSAQSLGQVTGLAGSTKAALRFSYATFSGLIILGLVCRTSKIVRSGGG